MCCMDCGNVMIVIMLVMMRISGVSLIFVQAVQNVLHIVRHNINMKTQQSVGSIPTTSVGLRYHRICEHLIGHSCRGCGIQTPEPRGRLRP